MNELTPDEHNIIVDAIHDSAIVIHKGQRMNERIKQITGQVLDELVPETWVALGYDEIKEIQFRTAELIVRECAELFVDQKYMILNPHEPFANERVRALKEHDKDTVRKIKQHFGVLEE